MKTVLAAALSAVIAVSLSSGLSRAQAVLAPRTNEEVQGLLEKQDVEAARVEAARGNQDVQAPREHEDVQAPRENQDVQAPRENQDVQAPRT